MLEKIKANIGNIVFGVVVFVALAAAFDYGMRKQAEIDCNNGSAYCDV